MYEYFAKISNIVDGDTLDLEIELGFSVVIRERVRLARIDAYETRLIGDTTPEEKQKGIEAKGFLQGKFWGRKVLVRTEKDKVGKYGRYIADIFTRADDDTWTANLNDLLVEKGYAVYKEY